MKNLIIFLILILLPQFAYAKENLVLKGYWFECEFSEKTLHQRINVKCLMTMVLILKKMLL